MAKQEFINNLRAARDLFAHSPAPVVGSSSGGQAVDPSTARAAVWLRPQSVKGFDVADFPELDDRQKTELQAAVDEFLRIAKQVRPPAVATVEQLAKATPAFENVLSILHWYLGNSPEEDAIEETLKNVQLPTWVVNWDFELVRDHYDEPVLFLNLFMANDDSPRAEMIRSANDLSSTVREVLLGIGCDRYPYMRIRKSA